MGVGEVGKEKVRNRIPKRARNWEGITKKLCNISRYTFCDRNQLGVRGVEV